MTYWLSVWLLLDSVIEVACIITNYPGDSIDCQFAAVYSVYILEKLVVLVWSNKNLLFAFFNLSCVAREDFFSVKIQARFDSFFSKWNVTDFNHEKQIFSNWVTQL